MKIVDRTESLDSVNFRENMPNKIILHSTRSYPEFEDVLSCHKDQKGWSGMGYHLFIADSDIISQGRPYQVEGAHALGYNTGSIGLCIYSPSGKLDKKKIKLGQKLIDHIRREHGDLELMSHTHAQVLYNNKLLEEAGINERFEESDRVVEEKLFLDIKKQMDKLAGRLDTESYKNLKSSLKYFKNCPGEMFFNFK